MGSGSTDIELTPRQEIESTVWQILCRATLRGVCDGKIPANRDAWPAVLEDHYAAIRRDLVAVMHCVDRGAVLAIGKLSHGLHNGTGIDAHLDHDMINEAIHEASKWG